MLWDDPAGAEALTRAANFGFNVSRRSESAGTNAKLSEIHAAVGHAMLDGFAVRRRAYAETAAHWAEVAAELPGRMVMPPDLASVYILWDAPSGAMHLAAEAALTAANVDYPALGRDRAAPDGAFRDRAGPSCHRAAGDAASGPADGP